MAENLDVLFNSSSVNDLLKFYENFENSKELIYWMKNRPKKDLVSYEYDRNSEIVVVVPTISHLGTRAKNCVNQVYEDLTVILVESGISKYFNYARSVNFGLKKALQYNPKWLIVSNDDVFKKDPSQKLLVSLRNLNDKKIKLVFTKPEGKYHSVRHSICQRRFVGVYQKVGIPSYSSINKLEQKFEIIWTHSPNKFPFFLTYKKFNNFLLTASFSIFSGSYIKTINGDLFDETYINGVEDIDLAYSLTRHLDNYAFVDYLIGEEVGASLGNNKVRKMRDIANLSYLNSKIKNGEIIL